MTTIPSPTEGLTTTARLVPPATPTIQELCDRAGSVVNTTTALAGEVANLHSAAVTTSTEVEVLRIRRDAQSLAGRSMVALLDELAGKGFAWRDIAAVAGVSVPAVRKWRQGGSASGGNRHRVAVVVALVEWLEREKLIDDVASWLEIPLLPPIPVTRLDLLAAQREDLIVASLTGDETPAEAILDDFDPAWRERVASDFEVFEADDGLRSIRRRREG